MIETPHLEPKPTSDVDTTVAALNSAFDATGITFKQERADVLAAFKNGEREIQFDENGQPFATYDSQILPLSECLQRWAADAPDGTCDRRTLRRSPGGGRRGIASKQDLVDAKSKAAYIAEHGYDAFAALPTKAQPSEELKYKDQFYRLPLSEKSRLIAKHGENFIRSLPSRPTGQPHGGFIAHELLEKQKQIRGKSAR